MPKTFFTIRESHKATIDESAVELEELTAAERKMINQMYDKKGNLTPLGKKVMNHGKAASKLSPKDLAKDNARRKEYNAYQKKNRNEEVEEIDEDYKITKIYNPSTKKSRADGKSTSTYAVHTKDRKYFKEFPSQQDAQAHLKSLAKKEEVEEIDEISADLQNRYKDKAWKQYKASGDPWKFQRPETRAKHAKRYDKRHKGIGSVIKRTKDVGGRTASRVDSSPQQRAYHSMTKHKAPYKNNESVQHEVLDTTAKQVAYRDKAKASNIKAKNSAVASSVRGDKDDFKKSVKTMDKRKKGIELVTKKAIKKFRNEKFVSAAQRKAVWANKADGGKGHPDNKKESTLTRLKDWKE